MSGRPDAGTVEVHGIETVVHHVLTCMVVGERCVDLIRGA
jgi:hypothetical protein